MLAVTVICAVTRGIKEPKDFGGSVGLYPAETTDGSDGIKQGREA